MSKEKYIKLNFENWLKHFCNTDYERKLKDLEKEILIKEKIYEKIIEELWDSGFIPDEIMETINKIKSGELEINLNDRWNLHPLTYTKEYYEMKIKELEEEKLKCLCCQQEFYGSQRFNYTKCPNCLGTKGFHYWVCNK